MKAVKPYLCTLAFFLSTAFAFPENWPQFRGPTGQSVSGETRLPTKWSATENVAWKSPIPGESWSSPFVWGDRVFVTTATEGGASCRVLAFDRKTGGVLWNKEVFQQVQRRKEGRNTYATPTPATDGERIYACFGDGSFAALNFAGEIIWTNRNYPFYSQHGLATSPIVYHGLLIMARDGSNEGEDKGLGWEKPWDRAFIVALDIQTGKERWKGLRGRSRISHGVPTVWEHDGKAEIVSEAGDVVQGFDAQTGERLWSNEVIGEGKVPSTVIGEGLVFTAGGWGGKESIKAFRLGGKGDQQETLLVWQQKKGMPKVPSLLYWKPYLFAIADTGLATCFKAATGEIIWQEHLTGNFSASPVFADGRIYFLGDNGETTVIEAGAEFKVLARNPLGEKVQASMAVSQGQLFIRTEKNLFCIAENVPKAKVVMVDDFESYSSDEQLAKAWYRPPHGGAIHQSREAGLRNGGRFGLKVEYSTTRSPDKFYSAICRVAKWDLSGCDAFQFWLKPDGSGRALLLELNIANSQGKNIHDLWDYTYLPDKGDTNARVVTVPFSKLVKNAKYADSPDTSPAFKPEALIEVALCMGGRNDEPGDGVYYFDDFAGVRAE